MSRAEIRHLAVLLVAGALAPPPAVAATRATLHVSAERRGAVVTVTGHVKPVGAGRRVIVLVRRSGETLARVTGPLHRDGTFSTRVDLIADPGPVRVVVTAGRLHLSRTLA